MEWLSDLAARLPAPRIDEPPELRTRIVAELRDHLQAAYERELLLTADSVKAQRNVLVRFGDPARLARKLWFDAMWEKIMSQRLMIVALALVVLVCLGSMGLTWVLIDHTRQANQALVEQSQKANDALLSKISALAVASSNAGRSMEWNSIHACVTTEKVGGTPVSGCKVTLRGHLIDVAKSMHLVRKTDVAGTADFGMVRPGQHYLDIETPSGEYTSRSVLVQPGEPNIIKVIAPPQVDETDVTMAVDWPQELANRRLWLICSLLKQSRVFDDAPWTLAAYRSWQIVAVNPEGKLMTFHPGTHGSFGIDFNAFAFHHVESVGIEPGIYKLMSQGNGPPPPYGAYLVMPVVPPVSELRWSAGTYRADRFFIARELDRSMDAPADRLMLEFLGGVMLGGNDGLITDVSANSGVGRRRIIREEIHEFVAHENQRNEWRLPVPQSLVTLLKQEAEATEKSSTR